jgi:tripartite-type tricarboxylate transporter receptor subunit TctC
MQGWVALIGPAGLPQPVVAKLSAEVSTALATKQVQDALTAQGFKPIGNTPAAAATMFQTEMAKYAKLVKQSGMTID